MLSSMAISKDHGCSEMIHLVFCFPLTSMKIYHHCLVGLSNLIELFATLIPITSLFLKG
ncbi:hypothetical protein IFM89_025372, partial [Coptis chinensis]